MFNFLQARKWQSCDSDPEVFSKTGSTLSRDYKFMMPLGSLGHLKCQWFPLCLLGSHWVLRALDHSMIQPSRTRHSTFPPRACKGALPSSKWDTSLALRLVCSQEKAGEMTWQAISGGMGVAFLPQNLDGCLKKITFV